MPAGKLSHRVAFDKRQDVTDQYGNTQSGFRRAIRQVWGGVQAKFGGEAVTAARLTGQQPVTIIVRQSTKTKQIATDWRARDVLSGQEYAIRSIVDPDDKRQYFEILTQTGVAA